MRPGTSKFTSGSSGRVPLDPGVILHVLLDRLWRPGINFISNRVPLWVMGTSKLTSGSSGSVPLDPGAILDLFNALPLDWIFKALPLDLDFQCYLGARDVCLLPIVYWLPAQGPGGGLQGHRRRRGARGRQTRGRMGAPTP